MANNFKVKWNGDKLTSRVREAAFKGLVECGSDLDKKSQELCPKDKGYDGGLVSTATLVVDKDDLRFTESYDKPYARRQHYENEWKHKGLESAFYLQRPLHEWGARYVRIIGSNFIKPVMSR